MSKIYINGKKVDNSTITIDGVDSNDYPDFCDAFVDYAEFEDGTELQTHELEILTDSYNEIVNELSIQKFL